MAGATRDDRRGARDGSDRIARIGRWLATPVKSKNVDRLSLTLESGEGLGSWDIEDVRGAEDAMAYRIDSLLLDAANDEGTTITARLAWMAGESVWLSKNFRAKCDVSEQEHVRPLDGSTQSLLQQMQRHNEAYASQIAQFSARSEDRVERQLGIFERMLGVVLSRLEDAEVRRYDAEAREVAALELAEKAAGAAESAQAEAEQAVNAKDDTMGKVIEIATKQLMGGSNTGG